MLVSFAYPLVIEPVFNKFASLPPGVLRTALLDLATRDSVHVKDILVADASRRTTTLNAYVSGLGATRRIVVFDTLLDRAESGEVESVVAHELGHTKNRDVLRGTVFGAVAAAAAICALFLLLQVATPARSSRRRVGSGSRGLAADPGAARSAGNDRWAAGQPGEPAYRGPRGRARLDLTGDPATFARMERQLALANIADLKPHPLVTVLFATHPSAPQRIALARSWARAPRTGASRSRRVSRTLVITNDFPPRPGGIQAYLHALLTRQPAGSVVVYASRSAAGRSSTPSNRSPSCAIRVVCCSRRRTPCADASIARAEGCDTVLYGAMAPLGLLTSGLRAAGVHRFVGMTHGHEAGWAALPVSRPVLRRIADSMDAMTYLTEYTRAGIAAVYLPLRHPG